MGLLYERFRFLLLFLYWLLRSAVSSSVAAAPHPDYPPALCLSRCSQSDGDGARIAVGRAARVVTAVLLLAACFLLAAAAFVFFGKRRDGRGRGGPCDDVAVENDMELGPPWEVTMYQKMDIWVKDVARCLTPANEIGKGWSGNVFRANLPSSGVTIAVKRFRTCDNQAAATFACEIGMLGRVRHRNIVRLLGWAANRKTRLLFYDYLPNGSLGFILHGTGGSAAAVLEWETRLAVAVGMAEGLAYLHHDCIPGILHRDVKVDNVLLGERYEACLADFGLSRVVDKGECPSPGQMDCNLGSVIGVPASTLESHAYPDGSFIAESRNRKNEDKMELINPTPAVRPMKGSLDGAP